MQLAAEERAFAVKDADLLAKVELSPPERTIESASAVRIPPASASAAVEIVIHFESFIYVTFLSGNMWEFVPLL